MSLAVQIRPQPRLAVVLGTLGVRTKDLAEVVQLNPQYLSGVIHGRRRPSRRVASSIASALDMPVAELWPDGL